MNANCSQPIGKLIGNMAHLIGFYILLGMVLATILVRGGYTIGKSLGKGQTEKSSYWKGYEDGFNSAHSKYDRIIKYLRYLAKQAHNKEESDG